MPTSTRSPTVAAAAVARRRFGGQARCEPPGALPSRTRSAMASSAARAATRRSPVTPVGIGATCFCCCFSRAAACWRKSATTLSTSARASRNCVVQALFQLAGELGLALAQGLLAHAQLPLGGFGLDARLRGESPFVVQRLQLASELGHLLRQADLVVAPPGVRGVEHRAWETQARGDLEREAAAGRSVDQPIRRGERLRLEAERRAGHAGRAGGVRLDRLVVRSGDHHGAALAEVVDDGHAERAALDRVGAVAHFVEQHQRRQLQRRVHGDDAGDVPGERAQVGRDRLLVADVGKHAAEHRQPSTRPRRARTIPPAPSARAGPPS